MPKSYIVQSGDRLARISQRFYGTPDKFHDIIISNPILGERREQGLIAADGNPIIYAGDVLIIPDETENITNPIQNREPPETIETTDENALTIVIDGKEFVFFTGYELTSRIDDLDDVSISSPYFDNDEYREGFQPLTYKEAAIYYGQDLFFNGILYAPQTDVEPDSKVLTLGFIPKCGKMKNSPFPISFYPTEFNGLNLKQIAESSGQVFGVRIDFQGDPGAPFEKVNPSPTENVLGFLVKLAKDRGFLVTNNKKGELVFWRAASSPPVAFLQEGELPFISCSPSFAYENYFSEITGLTPETEETEADSYTWKNPFLPGVFLPTTREFTDIDNADLKATVEAAAGRMFGSAAVYPISLNSTRNKDGDFFQKNQTIRAVGPNCNIYRETNFLIKEAALSRSDSGDSATLTCVLPGAYTGTLPEVVPWVP